MSELYQVDFDRRLHIAIDASRTTIARRTGTENYALQLVRALIALDSPHRLTLFFRESPDPALFPEHPLVAYQVIPFRRAWTHLRFAAAIASTRPDVTFVPAHTLPFVFPGKAAVTIHDLGYRYFPEAHPIMERLYLDLTTRYSANRAAIILADSLATRNDLISQYRVNDRKIEVVYPGVEGLQRADKDAIRAVKTKYRLPDHYFLFLSTLHPRKNIRRLALAYARYLGSGGDPSVGLVLAGKPGWLMDLDRDVWPFLPEGVRDRITVTGYVDDADVAALYSGALALTFPSLFEGFGFPVIEAMRCGTPVLCSNTSSLPELAGDAALTVDPSKEDAIATGMLRLGREPDLREKLIRRGEHQAEQFTWLRSAEQALHALERAAY